MEQRSRISDVTQEVRCGSLYMVDLAGSERAAVTQVSLLFTRPAGIGCGMQSPGVA